MYQILGYISSFGVELPCGDFSFCVFGAAYRGDPQKLNFWKPIVNSIIARLSSWKSKFLSLGSRLILLKSVLSSLPVYFLSFFKAPVGIISSIESLF